MDEEVGGRKWMGDGWGECGWVMGGGKWMGDGWGNGWGKCGWEMGENGWGKMDE